MSRPLFLQFTVQQLAEQKETTFFTDEFRNPTYVGDIVQILSKLIAGQRQLQGRCVLLPGVSKPHISANGIAQPPATSSRHSFCCSSQDTHVMPTMTSISKKLHSLVRPPPKGCDTLSHINHGLEVASAGHSLLSCASLL